MSGTLDASRVEGYVRRNALAAPLTQVQIGEFFILGALGILRMSCNALRVPKEVLVSWTHAMVYLRNLSAHHGRVWNRKLAVQAMVPRKWAPAEFATDRIFRMASVLEYLERKTLGQSLAHSWSELLNDFPAELQASMGVPANWRELWDGWTLGAGVKG